MTPADKADALGRLRHSAQVQRERVQVVCDGLELAAEQVQDVRLSLGESAKPVSVGHALFDVLLTFCLEGTVAGKILATATQLAIEPMLISRKAASLWAQATTPQQVAAVRDQIRAIDRLSAADIAQHNTFVAALASASGGAQSNLAAAVIAARDAQAPRPPQAIAPTDTPAVALLSAARTYASNQRLSIELCHGTIEGLLLADLLTPEDFAAAIRWRPLGAELLRLRDNYKLFFEAAIWARLYGWGVKGGAFFGAFPYSQDIYVGVEQEIQTGFLTPTVDERLVDYWVARLIDPPNGANLRRGAAGRHWKWRSFVQLPSGPIYGDPPDAPRGATGKHIARRLRRRAGSCGRSHVTTRAQVAW
jgi:hypothetical protein